MQNGSIQQFVLNDLRIFRELFDYDFHRLQKALHIQCFDAVNHYQAIEKTSAYVRSSDGGDRAAHLSCAGGGRR